MKKNKKLAGLVAAFLLLCACGKAGESASEQLAREQIIAEQSTTEQPITEQPESQQPESQQPESQQSEETLMEQSILTAKVPEGLQNLLKENFLAGIAAETLRTMVVDVVVEKESYRSYEGCGVDEVLEQLELYGGILLQVDADNDGTEDLFAWIRDGGSSGNTSFQLAKGKEDGTYEVTEYQGTMSQEIAFVEFEGQNYLVETDYDYNRKDANGFCVTCYEQGRVSEQVYLEAVASVWEAEVVSCASGYEALAEQYAKLGLDGFHEESMYDYRVDAGSGERVEEKESVIYYADINNDGAEEWYEKQIFYPSTIHSCVYLENDLYFTDKQDAPEYLVTYYDLQYEGVPLMFWVEKIPDETGGDKQVVCLLTYEGLSLNRIYGYLIEGENVTDVMKIEYKGQLEWRN